MIGCAAARLEPSPPDVSAEDVGAFYAALAILGLGGAQSHDRERRRRKHWSV